MKTWIAALIVSILPSVVVAQQRDFSKVEIESTKLAEGIYMLTGMGGNMAISVGDDGVFLVDDQFAPLSPKIAAAIRKISDKSVRFIMNTHVHGDHTGGNENFAKEGATIVAHQSVRERLSREQVNPYMDRRTPAQPYAALPVVTFGEDIAFHLNGHDISVYHTDPAHTDGDSIVQFRGANVVHTGDTFVNGNYPFIDISSGGAVDGIIASADKLLGMVDENTKIIPGHGPLASRGDLKAFRDVVRIGRDRVAAAIAEGKTLEQTVAAGLMKEYDAEWGAGFMPPERFVRFVYLSLTQGS